MSEPVPSAPFSAAPCRKFALAVGVLLLVFIVPLGKLLHFALNDDLHSHILLIPFISFYLAWLQKNQLPGFSAPAKKSAVFFFTAGVAVLLWHWRTTHAARPLEVEDQLAFTTLAFVLFLTGLGGIFLGAATQRALAFPFALLVFMIPLPVFFRAWLETSLQHGSAEVADWMFQLAGMTMLRTGMIFQLPGMTIEVARECSGVHSTFMLFITSLIAGQMFLRHTWRRVALCLFVIPLALARNGLRIFVIGELCVHIGPQMIDSPIHHRGGPLFFAVSLVPFFLWLYYLKKNEKVEQRRPGTL